MNEENAPPADPAIRLFLEHGNIATIITLISSVAVIVVATVAAIGGDISIEQFLTYLGLPTVGGGLLGIGRGIAANKS